MSVPKTNRNIFVTDDEVIKHFSQSLSIGDIINRRDYNSNVLKKKHSHSEFTKTDPYRAVFDV